MGPNTTSDQIRGLPTAPAAARDPREDMLIRMMITNSLMLLQFQFERARKPRGAKLCELLLLDIPRYMDELDGVKRVGVTGQQRGDLAAMNADLLALMETL